MTNNNNVPHSSWTDHNVLSSNSFNPTQIQLNYLNQLHMMNNQSPYQRTYWSCWAPTRSSSSSSSSDDSQYLLCGTSHGQVQVYLFSDHLVPQLQSSNNNNNSIYPAFVFQAHETGPVYCHEWITRENQASSSPPTVYLLTGGDQQVRLWNFSDIVQRARDEISKRAVATLTTTTTTTTTVNHESALTHSTPTVGIDTTSLLLSSCPYEMELRADENYLTDRKMSMEHSECTSLCYDSNSEKLFSVWGDGCIYVWDIDNGQKISKLTCDDGNHNINNSNSGSMKERISSIDISGNFIYSGCTDGSIRVWDIETEELLDIIYPMRKDNNNSSDQNSFDINSITVDADNSWMAFSAGYFIGVMHIRSKAITSIIPSKSFTNFVSFTPDSKILSAGCDPYIHVWDISGSFVSKVRTSNSTILWLSFDQRTFKNQTKDILVAVGIGPCKSVYMNGILLAELKS